MTDDRSQPTAGAKGGTAMAVEKRVAPLTLADVDATTILRCETGSTVHGLGVAGTDDRDELGVCIEPPEYVIGLRHFEQVVHRTQPEGARSGPGDLDLTIYGLRKFASLALKGNPSILLLFNVPDDKCLVLDDLGVELVGVPHCGLGGGLVMGRREEAGMSKSEEVIVSLLERFNELCDPMQSGNGTGDTGLRLMPSTYTASVRELERLLKLMHAERPSQFWHVSERYIRCEHVLRDVKVRRKAKNGKTVTVIERQLVVSYHPGVRLEKVRRGVSWIAARWDRSRIGEPMLPAELLVAA